MEYTAQTLIPSILENLNDIFRQDSRSIDVRRLTAVMEHIMRQCHSVNLDNVKFSSLGNMIKKF